MRRLRYGMPTSTTRLRGGAVDDRVGVGGNFRFGQGGGAISFYFLFFMGVDLKKKYNGKSQKSAGGGWGPAFFIFFDTSRHDLEGRGGKSKENKCLLARSGRGRGAISFFWYFFPEGPLEVSEKIKSPPARSGRGRAPPPDHHLRLP